MSKIYFSYKMGHDNHRGNNYTPVMPFATMFPFYINLWVVTMNDTIINESCLKKFSFDVNWTITEDVNWEHCDERFWIIEADDAKLTALWKDINTVIGKLSTVWTQNDVEIMTALEAQDWMRTFTNCVEEPVGTFEIAPAWTDIDWTPTEAVFLTID